MPTLLYISPHCLLQGQAQEASVKKGSYASVKTVRLTYQALELLQGLPKRQVQGALGHQQLRKSPRWCSRDFCNASWYILICASEKQVSICISQDCQTDLSSIRASSRASKTTSSRGVRTPTNQTPCFRYSGTNAYLAQKSSLLLAGTCARGVCKERFICISQDCQTDLLSIRASSRLPKRQVQGALGHQHLRKSPRWDMRKRFCNAPWYLDICLWKASSICISQDCQTDLSSIRASSRASRATSSRGARTPTNQTLCFRYSGTNAYLAQKSSLFITVTCARDFCNAPWYLDICLWKASSICISQDCQTDLSSIRASSRASKVTSSRGARTPTNQTLRFRYSGTNAYLAQKSSLFIAVTCARDFCNAPWYLDICLWKASSICISQDCQTDLSSIRASSRASKVTSSRGARTPTNQTLCFRYSGTNAYLAQKSSLLIAGTCARGFCYC